VKGPCRSTTRSTILASLDVIICIPVASTRGVHGGVGVIFTTHERHDSPTIERCDTTESTGISGRQYMFSITTRPTQFTSVYELVFVLPFSFSLFRSRARGILAPFTLKCFVVGYHAIYLAMTNVRPPVCLSVCIEQFYGPPSFFFSPVYCWHTGLAWQQQYEKISALNNCRRVDNISK